MQRILLYAESLGSGGAERQFCGLAIMLKECKYDIKVISHYNLQFYEPLLREAGVDYELHEELWPQLTRVPRLIKYVRFYKPDVVITFIPGPNKAACLAKLFCGYKLIVGERNTNISIFFEDKIHFNLYRLADAVVPNSFAQAEFIDRYFGFLTPKTTTIVNYVDLMKFSPAEKLVENSVPYIITAARFTEQKNYFRYIDAIALVRKKGYKAKFDFYGDGRNGEYVKQMLNKIKENNLQAIVTMNEPDSNIVERYRESDALCLPSIFEGYPNVLCEAMSTGLPVLCSNVVEMPRIVKENVNGYLFDPYNPEDIARAIIKFLESSKEVRRRQGRTNRKQIEANNTIEMFVQRYIDLINNICK